MWHVNLKAMQIVVMTMKEGKEKIQVYNIPSSTSKHGKIQRLRYPKENEIAKGGEDRLFDNDDLSFQGHHEPKQQEQVVLPLLNNANATHDTTNTSVSTSNSWPLQQQRSTEWTKTRNASSPYAYVWVVGGIHEDRPSYKGFLWTILISAKLLRQTGSTADFWAYFRLSPESKMKHLESTDIRVLEALGVKIVLLERPLKESFAQLVYDKFLTINMTQYKRVMFLDADVLPLTNLDYYFHLSDPDARQVPTLLRPNFIVASRREPCNTGMFMVEPSAEAFEQVQEVIRIQHQRALSLPYPHFDFLDGWGHNFETHGDYWEGINQVGTKWKFHAGHSDQGLMYYFAKYVRMDVSIAIGDRIQNWLPGQSAKDNETSTSIPLPIKVLEERDVLTPYQGKLLRYQFSCGDEDHLSDMNDPSSTQENKDKGQSNDKWKCMPPYDSMAHFMGLRKPWRRSFDFKLATDSSKGLSGARYLWFKELQNVSDEYGMGLDLWQWNTKYLDCMKDELLGELAQYRDILNATKTFGVT